MVGRVSTLPLDGFVVGVTADRRWSEQAELLRRRGAEVVHGPSIATAYLASDDVLGPPPRPSSATLPSTWPPRPGSASGPGSRLRSAGAWAAPSSTPSGTPGSSPGALSERLSCERRTVAMAGVDVVLQGLVAVVGEERVRLNCRERALLDALAARPGTVFSRPALIRQVWSSTDAEPHAVEVAIGRGPSPPRPRRRGVGGRSWTRVPARTLNR